MIETRRSWCAASVIAALVGAWLTSACGDPRTPATAMRKELPPSRLALGHLSSCLVLPKEEPRCWGLAIPPREAVNPDPAFAQPRPVDGIGPTTTMLASNAGGLCVLEAGRVRCSGVGVSAPSKDAFSPVDLPDPAVAIAVGGSHACAILEDRQVACWGGNLHGQAGEPMGSVAFPQVVNGVDEAVGLALGLTYSCALRRNGQVLCWGHNEAGMLGDGATMSRATPAPVVDLANVTRITARRLHTCALREGGTVHCWGLGDDGQLGDGKERPADAFSARPVEVTGVTGASDISAGNAHACALSHGQVRCWGANSVGQLGDGTTMTRLAPVLVPDLSDVVEIAAGGGHQCALRTDKSVFCWGTGTFGQTGQVTAAVTRPVRVALP